MPKKIIALSIIFSELIRGTLGISYWNSIGKAGQFLETMTIAGADSQYVITAEKTKINVFEINWSNGGATWKKTLTLSGYGTNIKGHGYLAAGKSTNVVFSTYTVIRFNADPAGPLGNQEYAVPAGGLQNNPVWVRDTDYILTGSHDQTDGSYRLYRVLASTINEMRIYSVTRRTRSYGKLTGSPWLVISLGGINERKLVDFTNGYDGGTNTATATHTKTGGNNHEVGFISPEDARGYYVVTSGTGESLFTVKETDGSQHLKWSLSPLTGAIETLSWVPNTDYAIAPTLHRNFALVDFMDVTKSTAVVYTNLPGNVNKIRSSYVWDDKKVLALSGGVGDKVYTYKLGAEMPCSDLCASCDGIFRKKCTSCLANSSPTAGDTCACDAGYYEATKTFTITECKLCFTLCATCSGGLATNCDTCKYNYMEKKGDGSCGCLDGKYLSGIQCLDCSPLCGTCSGGLATDCGVCKYSYMEKKSDGSCGCPNGQYLSGTQCLPCDSTCLTCSGTGPSACLSCSRSSGRTLVGKTCIKCHSTCKTCSGEGPDNCLSCEPSTGRILTGKACLKCDSTCKTCSGDGPDSCLSCSQSGMFLDSGTCKSCSSNDSPDCQDPITVSIPTKLAENQQNFTIIFKPALNQALPPAFLITADKLVNDHFSMKFKRKDKQEQEPLTILDEKIINRQDHSELS